MGIVFWVVSVVRYGKWLTDKSAAHTDSPDAMAALVRRACLGGDVCCSSASIFWVTVCKMVRLCYRSVICMSVLFCLSVTLVYCGQMVGWIKMKLCMEVCLGPCHIALDGDPAPPPKMGTAPNFRPMSIVAKRLYGSRCHLVRR